MARAKRKKRERMASRSDTTSSASPTPQLPDAVAGLEVETTVHSAASPTRVHERGTTMAEDDLGSIVEYSEDLADQEQPELLPRNDYEGEIRLAEQKISNTSGKKYAAVTFHIPVGQFPADYGMENNPDGLNIIYRLVPLEDNPRARFQCKRFVMAIGAKPGKRLDLGDWVGQTARVTVGSDTFEGVERETITKVQTL